LINYRVVPGSGINNEVPVIVETSNGSIHDKQEATNIKTGIVVQDISNNTLNNTQPTQISYTLNNTTPIS